MSKSNEVKSQVNRDAEKEILRDSMGIYSYLEFIKLINCYTLPGLAEICNRPFYFFLEVAKQGQILHGGFEKIDQVIDVFRKLTAMVEELQELNEPEGLITRLPNSDLEVNIMVLVTVLPNLEDKDHIKYYLKWGQP